MKTVGIIGGAGFIGSYNTKKFLENGYKVKVSATDLTNKEKYAHLAALPNAENLELVQMNVEDKASLGDFLKGCQIVIHGGTPFQLDVKDPKTELFDPTIEGTKNFMELAKQTDGIEQVVFIASVAAYNTDFPMLPKGKKEGDQITEADAPYSSPESHPYAQAKFMANQVVNDFMGANPNLGFEITTVSPVGVMGKSLSNRQDSTSTGIQFLFKNKIAPNPFIQMLYDMDISWALVDVEDVAEAIYKVVNTKNTQGKNYLLSSENYRISDLTLMLNDKEPIEKPVIVYNCALAMSDLGMEFKPAKASLEAYNS
ncbi:NAD-dependent epimerase/dehydratase family protein [Lacihabitans sp. LS3-19]|uniref:NAD-dependent epimerase/dehydratase family protein n=1 Tax=Lacihabitans sp. LS3-19 TaxID=2487335 RepID=UPI0020CD0457|nr:NAD-dependent epimerase/dehydratase family protein [Lacihabitans sp. LS3-19]MCP9770982.1 NAD-dependent epimerase/dehydratase family protein [Lacihabitans sp. LS3-19]